MTEKHPEDMTAGELLRWAAENDKLRMRCDMCMKLYRMDGNACRAFRRERMNMKR